MNANEIIRCTRCNEVLNGKAIRYLEGNFRTGTYHKLGDVLAEDSQGAFPFGVKCAKVEVGKSRPQ